MNIEMNPTLTLWLHWTWWTGSAHLRRVLGSHKQQRVQAQEMVLYVHCPCPDFTPTLDFTPSGTKATSTECPLARYAGLRGRKGLSCPLNTNRVVTRIRNSSRKGTVPRSIQWIITSPGPLALLYSLTCSTEELPRSRIRPSTDKAGLSVSTDLHWASSDHLCVPEVPQARAPWRRNVLLWLSTSPTFSDLLRSEFQATHSRLSRCPVVINAHTQSRSHFAILAAKYLSCASTFQQRWIVPGPEHGWQTALAVPASACNQAQPVPEAQGTETLLRRIFSTLTIIHSHCTWRLAALLGCIGCWSWLPPANLPQSWPSSSHPKETIFRGLPNSAELNSHIWKKAKHLIQISLLQGFYCWFLPKIS